MPVFCNGKNVNILHVSVETRDVSIVCVGETWFKDYKHSTSLTMQWFCLERKDRSLGRAGDVACTLEMF